MHWWKQLQNISGFPKISGLISDTTYRKPANCCRREMMFSIMLNTLIVFA